MEDCLHYCNRYRGFHPRLWTPSSRTHVSSVDGGLQLQSSGCRPIHRCLYPCIGLLKLHLVGALFRLLSSRLSRNRVPISTSFGRRPVLLASQLICFGTSIWRAKAQSYGSFMGACVVNGIGAGPAETIMPAVVADIFFLHDRGKWNTLYWVVYMGSLMVCRLQQPRTRIPMVDFL